MSNSDIILERMMSLHPKIIDLTLDRMTRLLDALGNPEKCLPPVIHLAGTNGKGSTQAMIRAGLEADGDRVHAYTSPHLARFHERIRLAGGLISEDYLTEVLDECVALNDGITITYFEITTCAALLAFARSGAEYTLLEVGLGGRLDATNVIDVPRLCVITPISIDHQQYLGETIEEIAAEKAGILKRGVYCVVGPQEDAALEVIEGIAAKVGAALLVHGQHWQVWEENGRLVYQDENGLLDLPMPNLIGAHQVQNAGAAIAALRAVGKPESAIEAAITKAEWPARLQRLRNGPLIETAAQAEVWLDGGHNPAAGHALVEALGRLPERPTYLVCGMLNTKDISGYLRPLASVSQTLYGVSIEGEAATLSAAETVASAQSVGMDARECTSISEAISAIVTVEPNARILICGSLYLAGRVLQENG
ncbi:MAG: folylpolyglutamate synthase/dihydrofolate synthase family protein [Paracoccaceae bacterium]|jgi:dihydrofolate synthase/folylpolyglutamate synthase